MTVLLTLGFYIVTILHIFVECIEVLDQDLESVELQFIRKLHRLHLEILDKLQEFETLFSKIQMVQTATSLPLIVGGFLLLRLYPHSLLCYLMYMVFILQFFVLCFFGEFIHSKTEQIFTALYMTRWYEMSLEDQMILLMMMKNTITPFTLMAAGMYNINMAAFLEVMKLSFTYSAILFALN
ncbi:Odorant receptor [Sergentomyia squamirostris]